MAKFFSEERPVGASGLELKLWGLGFTTLGFTADWDSQEILAKDPIRRVESQVKKKLPHDIENRFK